MKNIIKRVFYVCMSLILITSLLYSYFAVATDNYKSESILKRAVLADPTNIDLLKNDIIESYSARLTDEVSSSTLLKLSLLGFEYSEEVKVEHIDSNEWGHYTKYYYNSQKHFSLNERGEIINICNYSENTNNRANSTNNDYFIEEMIETVKTALQLSREYNYYGIEEVEEPYPYAVVSIEKTYNGINNPYESIKMSINKRTGNIEYLRRFNTAPETTVPVISKEDALKCANNINEITKIKTYDVHLAFTKPNYYWYNGSKVDYETADFVRLVYEISVNDGVAFVHVDAVTNEVIGGDIAMTDCAKCFGQTNSNYYMGTTTTLIARNGYLSLGYTANGYFSDSDSLRQWIYGFIDLPTSYGLYIRAHGGSAYTGLYRQAGGNFYPILYRDDVSGNWHFVFLDCCYTADNNLWADQFHISSAYSNRGYLGWYGTVTTGNSYEFAKKFWPRVGSMPLQQAASEAAGDVPGDGTTPIRFKGDTTYYGYAW